MSPLGESEIKKIAEVAAESAIRKLLLTLGVATGTEESVLALQSDFQHLRQSRLAVAAIKTRALMVATGAFITGLIAAMSLYLTGRGH